MNGAGKTTLFQNLIEREDKGVSVCDQRDSLFQGLTVKQNLEAFLRLSKSPLRTKDLMKECGLASVKDRTAVDCPAGKKRMLNLRVSLLGKRKVIVLDEPTTWMDPEAQRKAWGFIRQQGALVIVASHFDEEIFALCSHLMIIHE